jgi:tetratricopeptide (TPR) repeat protein
MCSFVLILFVAQGALADWPRTGNAKLDELLTKAKGAPHKEAFKMYEEAMSIKPDCADIFAERAIHYDESGQFNRAIEDCD